MLELANICYNANLSFLKILAKDNGVNKLDESSAKEYLKQKIDEKIQSLDAEQQKEQKRSETLVKQKLAAERAEKSEENLSIIKSQLAECFQSIEALGLELEQLQILQGNLDIIEHDEAKSDEIEQRQPEIISTGLEDVAEQHKLNDLKTMVTSYEQGADGK